MSDPLNVEQERARRLMAMGEMAASLAHEIRNPLGSMELFCTLLKRDLGEQLPLLNLAEQIHAGIRTLDRIISNCLQFTRGAAPHLRCFEDVEHFLCETLQDLKAKVEETGVDIAVRCSGSGSVRADRYQLRQALVNLLANSCDAVRTARREERAAVNPGVLLHSEITPEYWRISVIDRGEGISREDQKRVFDPFFSTKDGGTGLGLAIVHSIVNAHGGSIVLDSAPGEGTSVVIQLPRE
jgi:two-component system, sensor histidine kinase FlrB